MVDRVLSLTSDLRREDIEDWLRRNLKGYMDIRKVGNDWVVELLLPQPFLTVHKHEQGKEVRRGVLFLPFDFRVNEKLVNTLEELRDEGNWKVDHDFYSFKERVLVSEEVLKRAFPPPRGETTLAYLLLALHPRWMAELVNVKGHESSLFSAYLSHIKNSNLPIVYSYSSL